MHLIFAQSRQIIKNKGEAITTPVTSLLEGAPTIFTRKRQKKIREVNFSPIRFEVIKETLFYCYLSFCVWYLLNSSGRFQRPYAGSVSKCKILITRRLHEFFITFFFINVHVIAWIFACSRTFRRSWLGSPERATFNIIAL